MPRLLNPAHLGPVEDESPDAHYVVITHMTTISLICDPPIYPNLLEDWPTGRHECLTYWSVEDLREHKAVLGCFDKANPEALENHGPCSFGSFVQHASNCSKHRQMQVPDIPSRLGISIGTRPREHEIVAYTQPKFTVRKWRHNTCWA